MTATAPYGLAPLLYWFPGVDTIPDAWTARFGAPAGLWGHLAGLMRGDGFVMRRGQAGPGVGSGLLVAPGQSEHYEAGALRYEPTVQAWAEFETGAWCGISKTAGPDDFLRARVAMPLSYVLRTPRGEWWIPVALLASERCAMPQVDRFRGGDWRRVPAAGYEKLTDAAELLYRAEIGEGPQPARPALRDIAILALQVNYALTGPEIGLLGLLTDDSYSALASIITDRSAREKKTPVAAGKDISSGAVA